MMKHRLLRELPWLDLSPSDKTLSTLVYSLRTQSYLSYCIQGPTGAGKTRLMFEASKALKDNDHFYLCCIDADCNDLYLKIVHALNGERQETSLLDKTYLIELLCQLFEQGKSIVIFIDSAEKIDNDLLKMLFDLTKLDMCLTKQGKYLLTLVLFVGMAPIDLVKKKLLSTSVSHTLAPMGVMQVKRLIDHVYQFLGKTHQFSSADISRLHGMSYGYPGRLFNLLALKDCRQDRIFAHVRTLLIFGIAIVLTVLLLIFFVMSRQENNQDVSILQDKDDPQQHIESVVSHKRILGNVISEEITKPSVRVAGIADEDASFGLSSSENHVALSLSLLGKENLDQQGVLPLPLQTVVDSRNPTDSMNNANEELIVQQPVDENKQEIALPQSITPVNIGAQLEGIEVQDHDKSIQFFIQLTNGRSRNEALDELKGRSVPGVPKIGKVMHNGTTKWVTYIGPYGSKKQAETGIKRLPVSLQRLKLQVITSDKIK